jgi:opacity protein-like surface antigen
MKTTLLIAGALLASTAAQSAGPRPYMSGKASYSFTEGKSLSLGVPGSWENHGKDIDDETFGSRLALGVAIPVGGGAFRTELEWGANGKIEGKSDKADEPGVGTSAKIKTDTFMLNAYYDVDTGTPFVPYIGFGLGYAKTSIKSAAYGMPAGYAIDGSFDDDNFAWNAGAGIGCALGGGLSLDAGYRYTDLGKTKGDLRYDEAGMISSVVEKGGLSSHEVAVGARYIF